MEYRKKAEELASLLSNSSEFNELKRLHKDVYKNNENNKKMIDDFKKHIFEYQIKLQKNGKEDPEDVKKLQNLQNIIMTNHDIAAYLQADAKFSIILKEVYDALEKGIKLEDE
ncbi:YlbF family regulator [uncultured Finegoldia sp.]|uniref:YlbF family regulator n=1 Tax=uncultured Finegoldia sp. TaxID=328009 RepID=UPI002601C8C4|nr:YlbF family regulator [uncultured Finegoldia sp.]